MQDTNKVTRPLTPPPATFAKEKKAESPHRIPDFDFESKLGKSFDMDVDMENSNDSLPQSMMRTSSTEPLRIIKRASTNALNTIPSPSKGEFGLLSKSSSDALSTLGGGSTTGRIRQRISKDMIRAKMEERKAIQSLARTNSDSETEEDTLIETNSKFMNRNDKALPAHPQDSGVRPQLRPRAQTRSAQDILEQVAREGTLVEPKSALDQLVSGFSDDASSSTPRPQSLIVRHVSSESVLTTQPARTGLPTVASSSLHPISEMATTDSAMTNDVTLAPVVTTMANRPRRRRSMSTGDARPQHSRAVSVRMPLLMSIY
jgi:serine/arginine repetitive matrix protein 2